MSTDDKVFCAVFGSLPLIMILLFIIIMWHESVGNYPKIKFKSFKNFYELNNTRWILYADNVVCFVDGINNIFHFGLIDFYRYKFWKCRLEKFKEDKRKAQITARMVAAVKQDIAASEQAAQQYQNEAIQTIFNALDTKIWE